MIIADQDRTNDLHCWTTCVNFWRMDRLHARRFDTVSLLSAAR